MKNMPRCCFLLLILLTPLFAYGNEVFSPYSYATASSNNKYVFVMIAPVKNEQNTTKEARELRAKYPRSGMYLNDGSIKPLWTVDWYSFRVSVAADGIHLVRHGPLASSISDEAFTFFAYGKQLRSYKVSDVARNGVLQTVSHIIWKKEMKLDDNEKSLSVITLGNETYDFDYRSGERMFQPNVLMARRF